jgi:hypothetical protein
MPDRGHSGVARPFSSGGSTIVALTAACTASQIAAVFDSAPAAGKVSRSLHRHLGDEVFEE